MKKIAMLLALVALISCAGKQYKITEGPFRAKFARPFSFSWTGQPWSMPIFFDGVLPEEAIHVEGYLLNNGARYQQYHSDLPGIRMRMFTVKNTFTHDQYCEAVGQPMDMFDADDQFWNRGYDPGNEGDPLPRIDGAGADGKITILFKFFNFKENRQGKWVRSKLLTDARTVVKLDCPMCSCGGRLN